MTVYYWLTFTLLVVLSVILALLLKRVWGLELSSVFQRFEEFQKALEAQEQRLKMEIALRGEEVVRAARDQRLELSEATRHLREELGMGMKQVSDTTFNTLRELSGVQKERLSELSGLMERFTGISENKMDLLRSSVDGRLGEIRDQVQRLLKEQRQEFGEAANLLRGEVIKGLKDISETILGTLKELTSNQKEQLLRLGQEMTRLSDITEKRIEALRTTVDLKLKEIQEHNTRHLEEIRRTVDQKLSETLEKRLGDSFRLVSERLEAVHKGLGEMQSLAAGVGDLKRVLTNVKARGTWAEVQLGSILEQILTPDQYAKNVQVRPESSERVEFAIRLPGPKGDQSGQIWLPIDSKFPQEDYLRVQEAAEKTDPELLSRAVEGLIRSARQAAKDISDKYINPPHTTDFAIMFLGTEGLYAELLRVPGFVEELQVRYRVIIAGPTTLSAILCGLRMGFHTLAIEKRASEVWGLLAAVKTEFRRFGELLERLKKQLHTATQTLEQTGVRTRAMERRLRSVEEIPGPRAEEVLGLNPMPDETDQ